MDVDSIELFELAQIGNIQACLDNVWHQLRKILLGILQDRNELVLLRNCFDLLRRESWINNGH